MDMSVAPGTVIDALKHRYIKKAGPAPNADEEQLIQSLRDIADDQLSNKQGLLDLVAASSPDSVFSDANLATLQSVDDCINLISKLIDVDQQISDQLQLVMPELACQLLQTPNLPLETQDHSILAVLDLLVSASVGWSPDLGRAGEKLFSEISETVASTRSGAGDFKEPLENMQAFLDKEQKRTSKLEERLIASETGILRSRKSTVMTAQMINREMNDKKLTPPIIEFLQGPWYDSIQLLALTKGFNSEEWFRAVKMTETIIWTYQPFETEHEDTLQKEKQRLYRIIEHIPAEIRELLVALEHKTESSEAALENIESEHVMVISGQALEYEEFSPIETGEQTFDQGTSVSRILLKKVNNLQPGQWFTFEEDNIQARIKLVLKLEDIQQLLFTNRNGMKALEKSFDELAYYLSASVIKLLTHEAIFTSTFTSYYQGLVETLEKDQKQAAEDRVEADREEAKQEAARKEAIAKAKAAALAKEEADREQQEREREERLTNARNEAAKEENIEKVKELNETVNALNVGAWLKLPGADGVMEECKLAVKIAAADKMIFVGRSGVKIGEYSTKQLVQLLVAGEAVIDDEGVEFEDTLAQVVTKLRQDRNKSYGDLTGS
ncbi:MAG: hypothetical protein CMQ20_13945 [Gammaproteobacteria bacterium]|jgi:hypothetical protein|nr:hypothetical protein [Gammaproteobacteria bacterium]|tara:strand:- start:553 stop:2388 length:1836 start_codon:yes stop_codon:yes gene_type:complete